jgi:hypothetical protein
MRLFKYTVGKFVLLNSFLIFITFSKILFNLAQINQGFLISKSYSNYTLLFTKMGKNNHFFSFCFLILNLQSCYSQDKSAFITEKKISIIDSFPIFREKAYFQAAHLQTLPEGKILVWDFQKTNLSLFNISDKSSYFINSKGNLPSNFVGNDIYPIFFKDTLYVLETGNRPHLKLYHSKKFDLIDNLPLYKYLGAFGVAAPPSNYIQENKKIYLPLISNTAHFNESTYYKGENPIFGEIAFKEYGKFSYNTILKFSDFPEIENALQNNKKWWFAPDVVASIHQQHLYFVLPFSKDVYVYNLKTKEISKKEMQAPYYEINFTIKFDEIAQGEESVEQQVKLLRGNSHCVALQVVNNKIYYVYNKAFKLEQLPKDIRQSFSKTVPDYFLLVYDIETKQTQYINLGKRFRPNSLYVSEKNQVFMLSSPILADDVYVYQISWQ